MVSIGTSSNTKIPCLQIILSKKYSVSGKVHYDPENYETFLYEFIAKKDDVLCLSPTLEGLLGFVIMSEHRGNNNWDANDEEYLEYQKTMNKSVIYDDLDDNSKGNDSKNEFSEIVFDPANNIAIPCFCVIKSKGYTISRRIYDDQSYDYYAQKNDSCFTASTLEELLGIIVMWEIRSKNNRDWRANHSEGLEYRKIMDELAAYDMDGNSIDDD